MDVKDITSVDDEIEMEETTESVADFSMQEGEEQQEKYYSDLYTNKKISLGYCASVAEMSKEDFIQYLSANGISIFSFDSENDFRVELSNA